MIPVDALNLIKQAQARASKAIGTGSDFARAMMSRGLKDQRADPSVVRDRHVSCFGREPFSLVQLEPPCPAIVRSKEGTHHCSECKCPIEAATALDVKEDPTHYSKLHYPWLACPRKKKGFSNHEPP